MADTMIDPGMPQKVLAKARALGVHNDCLVSGNLCPTCEDHIMLAFDFFYADAVDVPEMLARIMADFDSDERS